MNNACQRINWKFNMISGYCVGEIERCAFFNSCVRFIGRLCKNQNLVSESRRFCACFLCVIVCVSAVREVRVTFREQELVSAFTLSRHIEQHFTNTHKRGSRDERDEEIQSAWERRNTCINRIYGGRCILDTNTRPGTHTTSAAVENKYMYCCTLVHFGIFTFNALCTSFLTLFQSKIFHFLPHYNSFDSFSCFSD